MLDMPRNLSRMSLNRALLSVLSSKAFPSWSMLKVSWIRLVISSTAFGSSAGYDSGLARRFGTRSLPFASSSRILRLRMR
ncbi:hypothetical protein D3C73_982990 [compost metagenome]